MGLIAITHVMLIDSTGGVAKPDQTIIIRDGRIDNVGASTVLATQPDTRIIDGTGHTLIPGLVGMHEHLFYTSPAPERGAVSYRAAFFISSSLSCKRRHHRSNCGRHRALHRPRAEAQIDANKAIGPELELTGPYLEGAPALIDQMHTLSGPRSLRVCAVLAFCRLLVHKVYMLISAEELKAGIEEAHSLGMKVTGHLCSVSFREAAEMGIDNLEHGPFVAPDSELYSKRKPGNCVPAVEEMNQELASSVDPTGRAAQQTIHSLVEHHVAITSTLAVVEEAAARRELMS